MDAFRPLHSLPMCASGLYEPYVRSQPQREARRNMDTQSDMIHGSEVDIDQVHHEHLISPPVPRG